MESGSTPSDAVQIALVVQARLQTLRPGGGAGADRIGIHVGEVEVGAGTEAASRKPKDLFGIQIDTCARVMSLAKGGQTLMTRAVFDSARQVLKGEDVPGVGQLEWLNPKRGSSTGTSNQETSLSKAVAAEGRGLTRRRRHARRNWSLVTSAATGFW